jgi:hypothetical protein
MDPEEPPMTPEMIERLRYNETVIARIAKILKCYPDQVGKEVAKLMDRYNQISAILQEWEGKTPE